MRATRLTTAFFIVLQVGFLLCQGSAQAQDYEVDPIEARVWLDRGNDPVLQRGESARLYYRVSEDAFVAIFHIDTNGTTRIVFPTSPQENHYARGGRDYRVLFPGSSYWYVNDDPGMGFFFIVASPQPFNFADLRYSHYNGGWDLSYVGRQVYGDPYLAMDDYVATLIPDWEYAAYGLDFTSYNVDERYEYPRFMCYDCHGFRPYNSWNPYHYSCSSFRVVIYNDPYYYPVTRYRGTRVVYVQPRRGVAHFSFKERGVGEPGTPQVVVRNSPATSQPGVEGTANRRAQPRTGAQAQGAVRGVQPPSAGGSSGSRAPGVNGTATRRPSGGDVTPLSRPTSTSRGSGQTSVPLSSPRPVTRGTQGTGSAGTTPPKRSSVTPPTSSSGRPVLERRPATGSSAVPRTTIPSTGSRAVRPSSRVKKKGGGTVSSSSGGVTQGRSTVRSTPPRATTPRPSVTGSRGTSSVTRPTVRSGGSTRTTPPSSVRSGGGSSSRPTVRSGGSARSAPARPPAARSSGPPRTAPARAARPPAKKRGGGGG